jgi:HK97 family phage portal protein
MSLIGSVTRRRPTNTATPAQQPRVPMVGRGIRATFASLYNNSDPAQQMEMFGRSGTLYSTVSFNAGSFSTVPWRMFRTRDGRGRISGPDPRTEVTTHAALDMWSKPNPWMPGQLFREASQQHVELTGLGFWVIGYAGSIPASMWPIRPDRMQPVPDVKKFIAGWVYTSPSGEMVPLKNSEVIWLRQPAPLNIYGGMGAVEPLLPDIEAARYVSDWQRNFFKNSANPGGFVQFPEALSDEQFDTLTERWAEQHQGVQRAHRVAFLEMGATFQSSDLSMQDMQFSELRQDGRDIIYEGYGTSKAMLGVVEDVNRSNIEGSEYIYAQYRLMLKLTRVKDVLNTQFLPLFGSAGSGVEFDFDNPVPKNWQADAATTNANASAAAKLVAAGYDPDDVAKAMSLPNIKHTGVIPATVMPPQLPAGETYEPAQTEKEAA